MTIVIPVVTEGNARKLTIALNTHQHIFSDQKLLQVLITQSLALLSDAAHMFTDAAALAWAAIQIAKRPADNKRTFGYQRFEILAALFNASMLFLWRSIFFTRGLTSVYQAS